MFIYLGLIFKNVGIHTPLMPRFGHLECKICRIGHLSAGGPTLINYRIVSDIMS